MPWAVLALAALSLALVTGASASKAKPSSKHAALKVGLVTDIGGLNDKGFNHLAYVGLQQAQSQLGVDGRVYITQSAQDRLGNLQAAAQAGYGLIVANGFLFFDQLPKIAPSFPNTQFAGT